MALYLRTIAPVGEGLAGEGDGTSPAPVAACHRERFQRERFQRERFQRERYSLTTPAAPVACVSLKSSLAGSPPPPGRSRGLLPPPRGGGQCMAIDPMAVHMGRGAGSR